MINIEFNCVTNYPHYLPYVNTLKLKLKDGRTMTLDRDTTIASATGYVKGSNYYMEWLACYAWDGETQDYDINTEDMWYADIADIDIEDEAPENYEFDIVMWNITDVY